MYTNEARVMSGSQIFFHTASLQAKRAFFYPVCTGYYYYSPGYSLQRNNYDSFLIMLSKGGECMLHFQDKEYSVLPGQVVLIDCYTPHAYQTESGWECLWLHFDGVSSREYYELIVTNLGNVFTVKNIYTIERLLKKIYQTFADVNSIREIYISQQICEVLTELALSEGVMTYTDKSSRMIEEVVAYVNQNISESLSLEVMAENASLSPYHFSRLFKKETGFSPYRFVLETRVNHAKFYLKTTNISIKELAYKVGFQSESSFCTAFKKLIKVTPSDYRNSSV